jgi:AhpD family alkylhydroperoxidase
MRLAPIEHPKGLYIKLAYRLSRRRLGKAVTPLKVVYARSPKAMRVSLAVSKYLAKGVRLERELVVLIETLAARLNGCGFCVDIAQSFALREGIDIAKVQDVENFRSDPRFSTRERAALAYIEAATKHRHVDDDTFAALKEHFTDTEIVEITLVNASENYYNLINAPLGIESDGLCALVPQRSRAQRAVTTAER